MLHERDLPDWTGPMERARPWNDRIDGLIAFRDELVAKTPVDSLSPFILNDQRARRRAYMDVFDGLALRMYREAERDVERVSPDDEAEMRGHVRRLLREVFQLDVR